jgi:hypothetical protein
MKRNPQWKSLLANGLATAALVLAANAQAGLAPEPLGPDAAAQVAITPAVSTSAASTTTPTASTPAVGTPTVGTPTATKKPNILVIWGDDIGGFNISANNQGMMGYRTPNIDSIAQEGALFTDWYGQQSCTAGRAAFITGQSPMRTGLTKVGLPGAPEGMQKEDPTIAGLLRAQGYVTGQFTP